MRYFHIFQVFKGFIRFLTLKPVFRRVAEESAEGDDGGEAGEVDEEVGGDALHRKRVGEVGQVERSLALDVVD